MPDNNVLRNLRRFEIPGVLAFDLGQGGLPKASVRTPWSQAEIYLHGAQVTGFQKDGEPPLLFLSPASRFAAGKAIRGGVPICFPWFGSRPGDVAHGFARITDWTVIGAAALPDGGATLRLALPNTAASQAWPPFKAEFTVTMRDRLAMELAVTNQADDRDFEFEECLHTYFAVGDIGEVFITGLERAPYLDKTAADASRIESGEAIRITAQTDRTYFDTAGTVEIHDPVLHRKITVQKSGSASTVVWNPWTTQVLPDLGPEEYRRMLCVE